MNVIPTQNVWFDDATTLRWARLSTAPANRFEILGTAFQCVRSSQRELLKPPRMASAIPPASMSKH